MKELGVCRSADFPENRPDAASDAAFNISGNRSKWDQRCTIATNMVVSGRHQEVVLDRVANCANHCVLIAADRGEYVIFRAKSPNFAAKAGKLRIAYGPSILFLAQAKDLDVVISVGEFLGAQQCRAVTVAEHGDPWSASRFGRGDQSLDLRKETHSVSSAGNVLTR
jgi:hypothetical protein